MNLALLGKRVGPPRPRQALGESLLDDHVVQAEVTLHSPPPYPIDQGSHKGATRERHHPQQSVDGVVAASRQEPTHACLRRMTVQEDQPTDVQRDQSEGGRRSHHSDPELAQLPDDLQVEGSGGTIESRRHEGNLRQVARTRSTALYPTKASLFVSGFCSSPYRVSPVIKRRGAWYHKSYARGPEARACSGHLPPRGRPQVDRRPARRCHRWRRDPLLSHQPPQGQYRKP